MSGIESFIIPCYNNSSTKTNSNEDDDVSSASSSVLNDFDAVSSWLQRIGFSKYEHLFLKNEFKTTQEVAEYIDKEEDLENMGITALKDKRAIWKEIGKMKIINIDYIAQQIYIVNTQAESEISLIQASQADSSYQLSSSDIIMNSSNSSSNNNSSSSTNEDAPPAPLPQNPLSILTPIDEFLLGGLNPSDQKVIPITISLDLNLLAKHHPQISQDDIQIKCDLINSEKNKRKRNEPSSASTRSSVAPSSPTFFSKLSKPDNDGIRQYVFDNIRIAFSSKNFFFKFSLQSSYRDTGIEISTPKKQTLSRSAYKIHEASQKSIKTVQKLIKIEPNSGPMQGGTPLLIYGEGANWEDTDPFNQTMVYFSKTGQSVPRSMKPIFLSDKLISLKAPRVEEPGEYQVSVTNRINITQGVSFLFTDAPGNKFQSTKEEEEEAIAEEVKSDIENFATKAAFIGCLPAVKYLIEKGIFKVNDLDNTKSTMLSW